MGMYCCCDEKITDCWQCNCDWNEWISCYDYPPERKNKHVPISLPTSHGTYLVRRQNGSADRYEEEAEFFVNPKTVPCGYTGTFHEIHWAGDRDHQPYAWKEIKKCPK